MGEWSSWKEVKSCAITDFNRQKFRSCQKSSIKTPFCPGSWMEQLPCGLCEKNVTETEDYNYDYSNDYSFGLHMSKILV